MVRLWCAKVLRETARQGVPRRLARGACGGTGVFGTESWGCRVGWRGVGAVGREEEGSGGLSIVPAIHRVGEWRQRSHQ